MKNKQGFTLVELLGVIAILGIIMSIATLAVYNVIETSNEKSWKITKDNLEQSAENYVKEKRMTCTTSEEGITDTYCEFSLQSLAEYGYIKKTVSNPITEESINLSEEMIRVYSKGDLGIIGIYDEDQDYNTTFLTGRGIS